MREERRVLNAADANKVLSDARRRVSLSVVGRGVLRFEGMTEQNR